MTSYKIRELPEGGVIVETSSKRIALDPQRYVKADVIFISHAHSDHLPQYVGDTLVLATQETLRLAEARGLRVRRHAAESSDLRLVGTGHILGSAGVLIEEALYYTGDLAGRARGFMPAATRVKCEVLVIESTYGKPGYVFPPVEKLVNDVRATIATVFSIGRPVAIIGYPLGKSQVMAYLLRDWKPVISFRSVERYSSVYREFGVEIPEPDRVLSRSEELLELKHRPAVILAPSTMKRRVSLVMKKLGGLSLWFSGWALHDQDPGTIGVPISDHADHDELVGFALSTGAREVYTTHGFSAELANSLRRRGVRASPLEPSQPSLHDFT